MRVPRAAEPAPRPPAAEAALPLLLVGARDAARLCGVSPATWHRLRAAGRIGPAEVRLGGRVLWRTAELAAWTEAGCPDRREWQARRAAHENGRG
jgi:predicted DNA-binding transcriptional regulator AlpA